jgi:hypothetical protein
VTLAAPFSCPAFTMAVRQREVRPPEVVHAGKAVALKEVNDARQLAAGAWLRRADQAVICFDLPKGNVAVGV